MSSPAPASAANGTSSSAAAAPRLRSLDVFRGFVISTMVFVNFLSGISEIPAWAKHMPGTVDGFTFVDLVFPAFLFMVGISIPLAQASRWRRGDTLPQLLGHILIRTLTLLFFGVILVNSETFAPEAAGMSGEWWLVLALVPVILLWSPRPKQSAGIWAKLWLPLKILAALALAYALFRYRGKSDGGQIIWLRHSWWGILGLIGWAYLNCSLIYLVTKGRMAALMGAMGFLIALYIGGRHGQLDWLGPVNNFVGVGDVLGTTSASVMAGVIAGCLFVGDPAKYPPIFRVRFLAVFGLGMYGAGTLLRPLHGIVKNEATDSYTLVAAGITCLAFLLFYCLIDLRQWRIGQWLFTMAGQNPLLAYLLPDVVDSFFRAAGMGHVLWPFTSALPGAINTLVVTALILVLNGVLTRAGLRLRM